ncbi:hypothetical protein [Streptomyces canus]|uniref:hypothetical protein n=1 Tax=Streptomyces canus TaxID=58343 RepID=UPI0003750D75|nr:hypothetical protein [Streptomyces canus]
MNTTVQSEAPTASPALRDQRENAEYLAALTRECERLGLALQLTDDPAIDMPEVKVVNGVRTCIARRDELGVALDDLRAVTDRCVDCRGDVDHSDPATVYYDGYNDIFGNPLRICPPCRDERTRIANDPDRLAFSRCMDAIEATFRASKNTEMTRNALRTFVDMTADEQVRP